MAKVLKSLHLAIKSADAAKDMALINRYSKRELSPEEVYCFSVVMCDNDIDRDFERFTDETLKGLAPLFVGKTVISDHHWQAGGQIGRIYDTEVHTTAEKNEAGQTLKQLIGKVYMLRSEENQGTIDAIEGGILKEVSVGCRVERSTCCLCGTPFALNWATWEYECEKHHHKGETYPGEGLCWGDLEEAKDAYELSFVAVPAQRNAGVAKTYTAQEVDAAFDTLLACSELSEHPKYPALVKAMRGSSLSAEERRARKSIREENEKLIRAMKKN